MSISTKEPKKNKFIVKMGTKLKTAVSADENYTADNPLKGICPWTAYTADNTLNILIKVFAHGLLRPSASTVFRACAVR